MINMMGTLWKKRELVNYYTKRLIAQRYRGSVLGVAWSFLLPLMQLIIYSFVFSVIFPSQFKHGGQGFGSFATFLFAGIILHSLLMEVLSGSVGSIISNPNYVKKVIFPLEILPLAITLTALFQGLIGMLILQLAAFLFSHETLGFNEIIGMSVSVFLLIPFIMMVLGAGYIVAALGTYMRDIAHIIPVLGMIMMFTSTIFFPMEAIPAKWQYLFYFNPLTYPVEIFRNALFFGKMPEVAYFLIYTIAGIIIMLIGMALFYKLRRGFADVI